jgi:hypothetical protein
MYVLVHHNIRQPKEFWSRVQSVGDNFPPALTLHHTLSASDGTLASCLWEAPSVDAVRTFLEPVLADIASNEYRQAENREGLAIPAAYQDAAAPST